MPPTRSPGPYALGEDEIAVPPYVEQLGADIYRKAFLRGWQEFGYQVGDSKAQENLKKEDDRLTAAATKAALSPSDQEKQADINKILAKMGEREKEFEYRVVPDVAFPKEGVPGYSELCERVEALYKSGYTDGWEANSLAYIRRHWNDPNKQHRKLP